jgi:hypothetical protein
MGTEGCIAVAFPPDGTTVFGVFNASSAHEPEMRPWKNAAVCVWGGLGRGLACISELRFSAICVVLRPLWRDQPRLFFTERPNGPKRAW